MIDRGEGAEAVVSETDPWQLRTQGRGHAPGRLVLGALEKLRGVLQTFWNEQRVLLNKRELVEEQLHLHPGQLPVPERLFAQEGLVEVEAPGVEGGPIGLWLATCSPRRP